MEMVCRLVVSALTNFFSLPLSRQAQRPKAPWELCTQLVTARSEICLSRIAGSRARSTKALATELLRKT